MKQNINASSDKRPAGKNAAFAFIEVAMASMVISLLVLSFIYVLQLTQKGTLSTKWRNQAMQVARDQMELIKSDIVAMPWEEIGVDTFPDYDYYQPVTVKMARGNIVYIADATVRFVDLEGYDNEAGQDDPLFVPPYPAVTPTAFPHPGGYRFADPNPNTYNAHHIVYVPTPVGVPGAAQISDVVLIRVDVYWKESRPRKVDITEPSHRYEGYQNIHLENLVSNRKINPPSGNLYVTVEQIGGGNPPIGGANVYLIDVVTGEEVDLQKSEASGDVTFEDVPAGFYSVISKNNESIQYGDDLDGPTGEPVGGYEVLAEQTVGGGDTLRLPLLSGGDVEGRVWARVQQADLTFLIEPVSFATVSTTDQLSDPVVTDANGYFKFDGANQVQLGTWNFWAVIYDGTRWFETENPPDLSAPQTLNGVKNNPALVLTVLVSGMPDKDDTPVSIMMNDEYNKTFYNMDVRDPDGNCLPFPNAFPVTIQVNDGAPLEEGKNLVIQTGPGCDFTMELVTGTHFTQVFINDVDGAPKDWKAFEGDIDYTGNPGDTITIANGVAPGLFPLQQPVATIGGTVGGLGGFDYSEFQVGLYDPSNWDLLYSFPVDSDGTIGHDEIPAQVSAITEYHVRLIIAPEYTVVADPGPGNYFPSIQFDQGVLFDLGGTPSFEIFRQIGYLSGIVKNEHDNVISTGVMVMAVVDGVAPPTELSHNVANVHIATTGEDGRYNLMVPSGIGRTTYDIYAYHTPRKINTNGSMSYKVTLQVDAQDQTVLGSHTLQAPLTVDFTPAVGRGFNVGAGYE